VSLSKLVPHLSRTSSGSVGALRRAAVLEPAERRRMGASVLLALGAVLAATALLSTSGYLISRAAQRPDILALTAIITAVRGLSLVRAVLRYLERLVSHDLALRVLARLRADFFVRLAPLGTVSLRSHSRGELLSRFVADVDSLQDLYLRALGPPMVAIAITATVSVSVYLMLARAGLALLVCMLAAATAIPLLTARIAAVAGRRQAPARAALTTELVESFSGAVELAVAGRGPDRVARIDRLSFALRKIGSRDAAAAAFAATGSALLSGATIVLLLLIAVPAVDHGALNPVLLAAIVLAALGAFESLGPLPAAARALRGCAESAGRLEEVTRLMPAVTETPGAQDVDGTTALTVALENVSFHYGAQEPWLLRSVNLQLPAGCRIAITGPSGCGKSTLAQLLVRFLDPSAGTVRVGELDARELTLDAVRATTVLIAQDAHVFNTTVRENLLLANRDATESDLWHAVGAVGLTQWMHTLPDGLDTLLGENGELISGGQRQRLTVARALVSRAPLILLDEPTAQLDAESATSLIASLDLAAGGRGLIVITHRSEGLHCFKHIVSLRNGRLADANARLDPARHDTARETVDAGPAS
jgi:thiol reductant ABC exporter CydC subunit